MRRRSRKQRVILRLRHREELKRKIRGVLWRSAALALVGGFALGLFVQRDTFLVRFVREHTPVVEVSAPPSMSGLPLAAYWPQNRFWLWIPGTAPYARARILKKYPAIKDVHFDKQVLANRIAVRIEPKVALVQWNGSGMDGEGSLFSVPLETLPQLPRANFIAGSPPALFARWLKDLAQVPSVWSQVVSVRDDAWGQIQLDLKTGTHVFWGAPEQIVVRAKAERLARILQDAHEHLGGAATADLRFFDEGRIIVRPK